ncbi:MAG: class I SAM-dependent methyltransferase [Candidatus Aminicenantes bacterium]|nr:class I SAM-dependent methyltransferase [Candidatus Aminicenantes bacterium]
MTKRNTPILSILISLMLFLGAALGGGAQYRNAARDGIEQPEKVMDATGVGPGMTIGEVGAGRGYFTFWLSARVEESGKVYANDIDRYALAAIERQCERDNISNIETVLGTVEDPRFPAAALDMVFMVNAFHDLARPVELLAKLAPALKPGATVIIMDRDPARGGGGSHFLSRAEVEEIVGRSVFELVRVETFLRYHNLYILRVRGLALFSPGFALS